MDKNTLYHFFAGTASYEEEKEVCRWVAVSGSNKDEFLRARKTFDLLLLHPAECAARPVKKSFFNRLFLAKIAAAVCVLAVSSVILYTVPTGTRKAAYAVAENKIRVPAGQCVNMILSDGTEVWLNAHTELAYPASFTGERKVRLNGEAYFHVAKDEKHPFIVATEKYDIQVWGTSFNVEAYAGREEFSTALIKGSVQVKDRSDPRKTVWLTPGLKLQSDEGKAFRLDSIRDYEVFRWREGLICFDHLAFPELMKKIGKHYGFRMVIENKKMQTYACSGKFRMADGIDFILRILQRNAHFTFTRDDERSIIYIH